MASVALRGIKKQYDGNAVLDSIDLDIADGELVVFVGPSGCGKSTLLRIIAGLEDISEGVLEIGGRPSNTIAPSERGIAMVFQSYALYPHMSVFENMGFALKLAKVSKDEIRERVGRAARILQIEHLLDRKPAALSGGQRQRVAIGRAIVRKPEVFLFDEPLSNLDAALRGQTRVELARLHRELGATMIYVTHDQVEAMTLGQKIVVLNAGRIEQVGTPSDLYERPANRFVAGFLGSPRMNFFAATLVGEQGRGAVIELAGGVRVQVAADVKRAIEGDRVTLGVRPEHLQIMRPGANADQHAGIQASVALVEYLGDVILVYAHVDGASEMVAVKCDADIAPPGAGSRVELVFPATRAFLFDGRGCVFAPAWLEGASAPLAQAL